ncbi:MAG TPA: hypothetical protein VF974_05230 [Patescibacteria group bacterium]
METNNQLNNDQQSPQSQPKNNWFLRHEFSIFVIVALLLIVIVGSVYLWKAIKTTSSLSYSDLAGTNANHNGVRDDVEDYILKTYTNKNVQLALFQEARAIQSALIHSADPSVYNMDVKNSIKAVDCLYYVNKKNAYKMTREIEVRMINTPQRLRAWLNVNNNSNSSQPIRFGQ